MHSRKPARKSQCHCLDGASSARDYEELAVLRDGLDRMV
jgi:hypothetical protein